MAVSLLQQQRNDTLYFKLNTGALSEPVCVFKFNCMEQAVKKTHCVRSTKHFFR